MELKDLPDGWTATRASLQKYAQAATAFARVAAAPDPRWSHVAMDPTPTGFVAAPVTLADGGNLTVELDLVAHRLRASAGDDTADVELTAGPAPRAVGEAIHRLAEKHGSTIAVERERFDDASTQTYVPDHATAFLQASRTAVSAMDDLNTGLEGEVAGPHLWPHGFDIATEWFSDRIVEHHGSEAHAQIAVGWYPDASSYVYVNPWPFEDAFARAILPAPATWHLEGWQGAKLDIPEGGAITGGALSALGRAVHDLARGVLRG